MNLKDLWQVILGEIELNVSKATYITWFRNTKIHSKENGVVIVITPSGFTKEWLENKYHKFILKLLRDSSSDIKEVKFIINEPKAQVLTQPQVEKTPNINNDRQMNLEQFNFDKETNLNPKYSFDNFVIGSFNELAQAASRAVSKHPGTVYNPLFIYGGVGLGKTHLLQAIGNELNRKYPAKKIKYLSSEKYTNELVDAISKKGMDTFNQKYHKVDTLIIDDIQFIAGKEKTQEVFFHTFNTLYQKNKQIIISSDRPPKAISTLEERLRSRFEGGMIADISQPDMETRLAILKNKLRERNIEISGDVLEYIATHVQKNIRELEGAFNQIIAFAEINNVIPTVNDVTKTLSRYINSPRKTTTCKNIFKAVSEFYDISSSELFNRSRRKELVLPRQIVMYLMRKELSNSYPHIGEKLGGRDHTTVMYACQKIEKGIENSESLQHEINLIKERIYSR